MPIFATTYRYAADSTEARDAKRPEHRAYLAELTDAGRLVISGPYVGEPAGALLLFDAESPEDAQRLTDADPFVTEGLVAEVTVQEWTPASGRLASQF
ncbi:MAG: YciI family protein [Aeromicrobium sp.]